MQTYANHGGDSNVVAYEIGDDFIKVYFPKGVWYRYTHKSTGEERIREMKKLAEYGEGLNSYITLKIKHCYESTNYEHKTR